jgi:hypothetical protein
MPCAAFSSFNKPYTPIIRTCRVKQGQFLGREAKMFIEFLGGAFQLSADFIIVVLAIQINQDVRMDYHACVPIDQGVLLF